MKELCTKMSNHLKFLPKNCKIFYVQLIHNYLKQLKGILAITGESKYMILCHLMRFRNIFL